MRALEVPASYRGRRWFRKDRTSLAVSPSTGHCTGHVGRSHDPGDPGLGP